MFARPSTGPVKFGTTARSRRRPIAVASARSMAVRRRRFWLTGLILLVGVTPGVCHIIPDSVTTVWYDWWILTTDRGREKRDATDHHHRAPGRLRDALPRAGRRAGWHRPDPLGQRHPPLHPLRDPRLQMPRRPTPAPRPLLPVDRQGHRQDRHPPAQRDRSAAVPGMDANDRHLRSVIQQMRQVAAKAVELKLKQAASP